MNTKKKLLIDAPLKPGSVLDNLSKSLQLGARLYLRALPLILLFSIIAFGVHTGWEFINGGSGFEELDPAVRSIYGDFISNFLVKSAHYQYALLLAYIPVYLYIYGILRRSEPFTGPDVRSFPMFIGWLILNGIIVGIGAFLAILIAAIPVGIVIALSVLLAGTQNIILIILAVILGAAVSIAFILVLLLIMSIASCAYPLSIYKSVYPIANYKYIFMIPFTACGSRTGGFFGKNLWHLVGLISIMTLVYLVLDSLGTLGVGLIDSLVPKSYSFSHILVDTAGIVMKGLTVTFYLFFMQLCPAFYMAENMVFNNYPIKDEIIKRAAE